MTKLLLFVILWLPVMSGYAEGSQMSLFKEESFGAKTEKKAISPSKIFQENRNDENASTNSFESFDNKLKAAASSPGDRPGNGGGIGQEGKPPALSMIDGEYLLLLFAVGYYYFLKFGCRSLRAGKSKKKQPKRFPFEFAY